MYPFHQLVVRMDRKLNPPSWSPPPLTPLRRTMKTHRSLVSLSPMMMIIRRTKKKKMTWMIFLLNESLS